MTFLDRIKETSTSTGTGTFTLGGAVLGYKVFTNGTYKYCIVNETETEWEVGEGTVASGVLTRTTIEASSNGGAVVSFSAGTKYVFNTVSAAYVNSLVPYTGATASVNLGAYGITSDYLQLSTTPTASGAVGRTLWNDQIGSTETTLKGGSVVLKNGVDLVARVVNKVTPAATLTKATYKAVRVSGAQGQRLAVAYAQANTDNNSADTIGLVCETIAANQEGFIITVGQLTGINTTGSLQGETWADGDVLYLSPTTAGNLTNIKPTGATGHIVVIGYVEYAHAINGSIYVKIMNGWELDELHNVYINAVANNDVLVYESSTTLWKNKSIATILGYTPADDSLVVHLAGAENITGVKTFQNALQTTAGNNLLNTGGGNTVIGYTADPASSATYKLDVNGAVNINTGILNKKLYTDTSAGVVSFKIGTGYELYGTLHSAGGYSTFITTTAFASGFNIIIGNNTYKSLTVNSYNVQSTVDFQALAGISNVTGVGAMSTYSVSPYEGFKTNTTNGYGFAIFNSANSPMMAVKYTGQMQLSGYTSTSVFTGTVAGLLGFDSSGNIITSAAGVTGSGTAGQVTYWSGTSAVTGSSNLFWDNTNGRLGIGTNSPSTLIDVRSSLNAATGIDVRNSSSGNAARSIIKLLNDIGNIGQLSIFGSGTTQANKVFFESTKDFVIGTDAGVPSAGTSKFQVYVGGYNAATNPQFTINYNGNVLLNTTTDGGQRLQVIGSMRVGTTAASAMYWDDTNNRLGIGTSSPSAPLHINSSVTASSAIARGINFTPTLVAAANNDVLVGLDISPTFTNGAFTGIANYSIRAFDNILITNNRNSSTSITVSNTTIGTASKASYVIVSSNGGAEYAKASSTFTTYKIITANTTFLYNNGNGDISILNDVSSGNINFAAGGSSTSHMTIKSNGRINMSSLPTSATGLSAGDLWNNLGIVSIV